MNVQNTAQIYGDMDLCGIFRADGVDSALNPSAHVGTYITIGLTANS